MISIMYMREDKIRKVNQVLLCSTDVFPVFSYVGISLVSTLQIAWSGMLML